MGAVGISPPAMHRTTWDMQLEDVSPPRRNRLTACWEAPSQAGWSESFEDRRSDRPFVRPAKDEPQWFAAGDGSANQGRRRDDRDLGESRAFATTAAIVRAVVVPISLFMVRGRRTSVRVSAHSRGRCKGPQPVHGTRGATHDSAGHNEEDGQKQARTKCLGGAKRRGARHPVRSFHAHTQGCDRPCPVRCRDCSRCGLEPRPFAVRARDDDSAGSHYCSNNGQ